MKRWLFVVVLALAAGGALYYSERHKITNHVGPEAVLSAAAEAQKDISHPAAQAVRLSDAEEIEVGNSIASRYIHSGGWNEATDAPIEEYVNLVGSKVASKAHRRLNYKFHYVASEDFINAFALPGGQIFIGKGLMMLMDSEDELAGVLGHEVEHVDHYDCNERVALEERLRNIPFGELINLPIALFQTGYNKEQEMEADRDGTALAVMSGYSPQGAVRMFQTFARLEREYVRKDESPQEELSRVAVQTIEGYFRSHPLPEERVHQIQALISSEKWPSPKERPLKFQLGQAKESAISSQHSAKETRFSHERFSRLKGMGKGAYIGTRLLSMHRHIPEAGDVWFDLPDSARRFLSASQDSSRMRPPRECRAPSISAIGDGFCNRA